MKIIPFLMTKYFTVLSFALVIGSFSYAQDASSATPANTSTTTIKKPVRYGKASYYANRFHGSKTASGETYLHELYTAACNILPLNTWIKITNLTNNTSIIAKINDRMHPKNKRLVDLSKSAAKKLGYVSKGLADVKVEVLNNYTPEQDIRLN